jgi:hypothetical protein
MPFKSLAQMRLLFAKEPKIAEEFATKTTNIEKLPEKVSKNGNK